jgi:hypothetical protein
MSYTTALVDRLNELYGATYAYGIEPGRVNDRVWMAPVFDGQAALTQKSVYCFVRKADGGILKSASYKAPAKGTRGYVQAVLMGEIEPGMTSRWLYR